MRRLNAALVALAAVVLLAQGQGGAQDGVVKIGVLDDMSGPYADNTGPGRPAGGADGGGGFRRLRARQADRGDLGRHAEQGRRRRRDRAALVRAGPGGHDHRHPPLGDRPRRGEAGRADEPAGDADRGGDRGADRQGVLGPQRALGLRHLRPGQDPRQRDREAGRRYLVLHHRRLRLRPRARAERDRVRQGGGRQGAGLGPAPAEQRGLLLLPAPGAELEGEGGGDGERRRRHHQRHQAGQRVRSRTGRAAGGRAPHPVSGSARHRPADRAGAVDGQLVLLGHDARRRAPSATASPPRRACRPP